MKTLVIYYSYDGNTDFIANAIAGRIQADVLRLEPVKEPRLRGFAKYFWGGFQCFIRRKPRLKRLGKDPDNYDVLFIGTPVWAWSYVPALESFLTKRAVKNKKIALFCCCRAFQGNVLGRLRQKLGGNQFIGEKVFLGPLSHDADKNARVAGEWAAGLLGQS